MKLSLHGLESTFTPCSECPRCAPFLRILDYSDSETLQGIRYFVKLLVKYYHIWLIINIKLRLWHKAGHKLQLELIDFVQVINASLCSLVFNFTSADVFI